MKKITLMLFCFFSVNALSLDNYNVCKNSKNESDMFFCVSGNLNKANNIINNLYKNLIDDFKKNGIASTDNVATKDTFLKQAQLAWIKSRDADCNIETYESKGGSAYETIYDSCLLTKTKERISYLQQLDN